MCSLNLPSIRLACVPDVEDSEPVLFLCSCQSCFSVSSRLFSLYVHLAHLSENPENWSVLFSAYAQRHQVSVRPPSLPQMVIYDQYILKAKTSLVPTTGLSRVLPDVLQYWIISFYYIHPENKRTTLLCSDSVDGIVRVTLSPDLSTDGNGGSLALDGLSLGINIGDSDLDGSVVLSGDETV